MSDLQGRVALVTGASRGIGAAVARQLSAQGVRLGLASRSGDDLGLPDTVAQPTDVRDLAALEALAAATAERFGAIDIVVANAGIGAYGPFLDLDVEHVDAMIDVNLKGTIYTARATLPYLLRSANADFISVASEAGRRGLPGESVYCASKFGQVGFVRSLEHELREEGVRASSICPGGVHTDFAMGTGREPGMPMLAGMMTPDDVADEVLHALTRPRHMRILETALRPMTETSWG
jgi:3-oxoacyl-[acyl-carrier protein] reductase